ncbi:plastocyanin/azurin family copper-binding protein [Sporosarcina sp. NPDC096371]|uniref:plastocyanin/azurin family copper-binding protein n=1 Tax=Sporosarcina sp. NPDC096371 TaxID=3364530 RepID=UPI00381AB1D1
MTTYPLFIFVSLILFTLLVVILATMWKTKLRPMQGMMISMFFGMNMGLTAGVLLGVIYQGNLFLSTILSITIGVLAGSLCGLCFGILSVLEGFMAGLMGGMMGAMLGEMIRVEQSIHLIQLFLFLSLCTIFIMVILKTPRNSRIHSKRWLVKPIVLFGFIGVYIVGGHSFVEKVGDPMAMGSAKKSTEVPDNESQIIVLETANMKYSTNKISVEKGRAVTLTLSNLDKIEHHMEIKAPFSAMDNGTQHHHGAESDRIHLQALPKSTETLTFTPTEPGVYEFNCTVPGHKESGMVGTFIVS